MKLEKYTKSCKTIDELKEKLEKRREECGCPGIKFGAEQGYSLDVVNGGFEVQARQHLERYPDRKEMLMFFVDVEDFDKSSNTVDLGICTRWVRVKDGKILKSPPKWYKEHKEMLDKQS